jgi:3-hydroxyacyl-[acyl-carrier-protein] dehydratase
MSITSPVRAPVHIVTPPVSSADGDWHSGTALSIRADEPVFAGHYPDFPIFPGVCLVECVHRSALATTPGGGRLDLAALQSARFLGPVYPGDDITISIDWRPVAGGWQCSAQVEGTGGKAAVVRLRYRLASNI